MGNQFERQVVCHFSVWSSKSELLLISNLNCSCAICRYGIYSDVCKKNRMRIFSSVFLQPCFEYVSGHLFNDRWSCTFFSNLRFERFSGAFFLRYDGRNHNSFDIYSISANSGWLFKRKNLASFWREFNWEPNLSKSGLFYQFPFHIFAFIVLKLKLYGRFYQYFDNLSKENVEKLKIPDRNPAIRTSTSIKTSCNGFLLSFSINSNFLPIMNCLSKMSLFL